MPANATTRPLYALLAKDPVLLSQEVVWCSARDHWFAGSGTRVELEAGKAVSSEAYDAKTDRDYVQCVFKVFVDLHDGCLVAEAVAVVWRWNFVRRRR